jgi:hypothetical protein
LYYAVTGIIAVVSGLYARVVPLLTDRRTAAWAPRDAKPRGILNKEGKLQIIVERLRQVMPALQ